MPPHLPWILLGLLLVCSATTAGSETALFALPRQDLRAFERSPNRFRQLVARLMHRPRTVLMTILLTNTAVNVAFFVVSFFLLENLGEEHPVAAGLSGVVAPFTLILFGEVLPKAVAMAHTQRLAPMAGPMIHTLTFLLTPLRVVLEHALVTPLIRLLLPGPTHPHVTSEELRALVEMSAKQGVINVRENEILQQILTLPETSVRAVMVPRVDMVAVAVDSDRETVSRRLRESGKKKIPVYGRDMDDIVGLIHAVDLRVHRHRPLRELLQPVYFVPEQANLLQLVQDFRRSGTQLAIVVDEYGGTAGLVSLEDVLEHIVGDIADAEETPSAPTVERIDDRTYRLSGDISVRALADFFGLRPGAEGVETLGGFILSKLGRLPQPGDVVRTADLKLSVERVAARRVEAVRVELVEAGSGSPKGMALE